MPLITDSEMEDFDAALLQAGFEVDDFNVVDLEGDEIHDCFLPFFLGNLRSIGFS